MQLLTYLKTLDAKQRERFALDCGTTIGYLRKAVSKGQDIGDRICVNIEKYSVGAVRCEDIRPDVDWSYLRNSGRCSACEKGSS